MALTISCYKSPQASAASSLRKSLQQAKAGDSRFRVLLKDRTAFEAMLSAGLQGKAAEKKQEKETAWGV